MKRRLSLLLVLCLALPPAGCARRATWNFIAETAYVADDEAYARDGTLLASVDYELPRLALVSDDAAPGEEPPEDMEAVLDAFNAEMERFGDGLLTLEELRSMAADDKTFSEAHGDSFRSSYSARSETGEVYQTQRLVSVCVRGADWTGGAHPIHYFSTWNFDLETGKFLAWRDITDRPDDLRAAIAREILARIEAAGDAEGYFPGYAEDIERLEGAGVYFAEDGLHVIFSEYHIAPYGAGLPEFTVPYQTVASYLNAYGKNLLKK